MKDLNPLESYQELLRQADELERMSGAGNFGGPTYWGNRMESTRRAIADQNWQPASDERMTWALPPESVVAIYYAFSDKHFDAVWKDAAESLRLRAAQMKAELQKHADEVAKALADLDGVGKQPP